MSNRINISTEDERALYTLMKSNLRKKLFKYLLILIIIIGSTNCYAKDVVVAGWKIVGIGENMHNLRSTENLDTHVFGIITIHNEQILFTIARNGTKESAATFIFEEIYLEQPAEKGAGFMGIKGKLSVPDGNGINGLFWISMSTAGDNDYIHFSFSNSENLYLIGYLFEEKHIETLSKLVGIGTGLKKGGKLNKPLSQTLEEMTIQY